MAYENLFDGRYRYDHIYPRGRSGEALRACDTKEDDRPVVIKRPAPQDAPPIRAGQEVNIRTERRALQALKGHPVLTELLGEGLFRVGGQTHLYIVLERADGVMLEDEVLELAARQERLPELETLAIVDPLLDLLAAAHSQDIVYNDVDAKHLFWDRERYQLKLIDWGNAVFLEGDTVTPQGISRQTDVYQAGELLYFIVTGGQRLPAGSEVLDFGEDASRITTRLQHIIQRAVYPALEQRYPDIPTLREELAQYRRPIERERAARLDRVERRLQRECSQRELERLQEELAAVLAQDPGYPPARALDRRVAYLLNRLAVLADLDATRIYLESGNWSRADALLQDVLTRAEDQELVRARLLHDAVTLAQDGRPGAPTPGLASAIAAIYADRYQEAARILLTTSESDPVAQDVQWLLAGYVQDRVPEVVVFRPHLVRIRRTLRQLADRDAIAALDGVETALTGMTGQSLEEVIAGYQSVVEQLGGLADRLEGEDAGTAQDLTAEVVNSARQAAAAAQALLIQLRTVGAQATANPEAARAALTEATQLDPVSPAFERLEVILGNLHRSLDRIAAYRPQADGADLGPWLQDSAAGLKPYVAQIGDPRIGMFVANFENAGQSWMGFQQALVAGNREAAVKGIQRAADVLRRLNPELSAWLTNVRDVVQRARYVQRHAPNAAFGRAIADGWMAWDRGSGIEAERLGRLALEEVANETEARAADRLIRLGKALRAWKEGNGEGDPTLTARIDQEVLALLTPEEDAYWQQFTTQMPSPQAYLESMENGLIAHFEQTSTPAQRVLYFHFVLRGVLEMYDGHVEDAEFWRDAAARALSNSQQHIAYMALTNVIRDRQAIQALVEQVDAIETAPELVKTRKRLERSPLHLVLKPLIEAMRGVEEALPAWQQGDFPTVGRSLEAALARLEAGEHLAHVKVDRFGAWLTRLNQVAAEQYVLRQRIGDALATSAETPEPRLDGWHDRLAEDTALYLGEEYAQEFVRWRDAWTAMKTIYLDEARRRSRKLRDMDEVLNRTARVDLHPAYPLYRRWHEAVEAQPEYPAPPTDEPVPQYAEEIHPTWTEAGARKRPAGVVRRGLLVAAAVIVVVGAIGALVALGGGGGESGQIAVTWETATPTLNAEQQAAATASAIETLALDETATAAAVALLQPSATETTAVPPTVTASPAATTIPTETPSLAPAEGLQPTAVIVIVTDTPQPTPSPLPPTPTLPPTPSPQPSPGIVAATDPVSGRQDILLFLEQAGQVFPWPTTWFRPGDLGGNWLVGVSSADSVDNLLQVVLPADLLAQYFGPEAAVRLRRIEATLTLRDYDRELIASEMVYFGLGLQGADESRVAVQALLVRPDAMNVGARVGNEFRARTTLPINNGSVALALERYDDGTVGLFLNGQSLGAPRFLTAPNAPTIPFLFVQEGGVVITVTDFVAQFD